MICRIYERRPMTMRDIQDPRTAQPVGQIEFNGGRHHENLAEIKRLVHEKGLKIASGPTKVAGASDVDFVIYVEPSPDVSPREAHIKARATVKKKPAVMLGGRKLPLPRSRG